MSKMQQIIKMHEDFTPTCKLGSDAAEPAEEMFLDDSDDILKIVIAKQSQVASEIMVIDYNGRKLNDRSIYVSEMRGDSLESELLEVLREHNVPDIETIEVWVHIYEYACEEGTVEVIFSDPKFAHWTGAVDQNNSIINEEEVLDLEAVTTCMILSYEDEFKSKEYFNHMKNVWLHHIYGGLKEVEESMSKEDLEHDNALVSKLQDKAANLKILGYRTKTYGEVGPEKGFATKTDCMNCENILAKWDVSVPYEVFGYVLDRGAIIDATPFEDIDEPYAAE